MEFDFSKFLYIAVWVLAVGSTAIAVLGVYAQWWYYNTLSGKMALIRLQLQGLVPYYRWKALFLAIFAWIAVFSFD